MKNEFTLAFNEVLEDKKLPKEVILEALESAMISAYRRAVNASNAQHVEAKVNPENGQVLIYAEKEVVESVQDERTEVALDVARKLQPTIELGALIVVETTPADFGRVAAQTARQVVQQRLREAERDAQLKVFSRQEGEIVSGVVQAITSAGITLALDLRAEGLLPHKEQIKGERFRLHDRVRALLIEAKSSPRGPQIIVSRAHSNFLRRMLENEVPEIYQGMVEIRSIAREPGQRSKVAVAALKAGIDPVGACVGIRGVRIQAIVRELHEEKIDVIEWSPDPTVYIAKALSPARVQGVYLNEAVKGVKTATVVVPEDQLSLAIGRDGQNARLAAKLTKWRIDIKSLPEAATDILLKLQKDAEYMPYAEREQAIVPQIEDILAKKNEGRVISPEDYQTLFQFVDRIERAAVIARYKQTKPGEADEEGAMQYVHPEAFEMPIDELEVTLRVATLLREAGYESVGALMVQMQSDSDAILRLQGIGAKVMQQIETALSKVTFGSAAPLPEIVQKLQDAKAAVESTATAVDATAAPEPEAQPEEVTATPESAPDAPEAQEPPPPATEQLEEQPLAETAEPADASAPDALEQYLDFQVGAVDYEATEEDEDDGDLEARKSAKKKGKKKTKKKYVEVEYDPDEDATIVKKKRKRGGSDWDELEWDG